MAVRSLADPNPPDRHLQTCPTLGPTSFGICAYEAAVRGHRGLARSAYSAAAVSVSSNSSVVR